MVGRDDGVAGVPGEQPLGAAQVDDDAVGVDHDTTDQRPQ